MQHDEELGYPEESWRCPKPYSPPLGQQIYTWWADWVSHEKPNRADEYAMQKLEELVKRLIEEARGADTR